MMNPDEHSRAEALRQWLLFHKSYLQLENIAAENEILPKNLINWVHWANTTTAPDLTAPLWPASYQDIALLEEWARNLGFRLRREEERLQVEIRLEHNAAQYMPEEAILRRVGNLVGKELIKQGLFTEPASRRNDFTGETTRYFSFRIQRP